MPNFLNFPVLYYQIFSFLLLIFCIVLLVRNYFLKKKLRIHIAWCDYYEKIVLTLYKFSHYSYHMTMHFKNLDENVLQKIFPAYEKLLAFATKQQQELESVKTGKKYAQDFFKYKDKKDGKAPLEAKDNEEINQKYLEYLNSFEGKNQLLEHSKIFSKNLMNKQEYEIYKNLVKRKDLVQQFIISPQVSFKAFIDKEDKESEVWRAYANLVADFLFIERQSLKPYAILEFLGSGHYGINNKDETDTDKEEIKKRVKNNDNLKQKIAQKTDIKLIFLEGKDIYKENNYIDFELLDNKLNEITKTLMA